MSIHSRIGWFSKTSLHSLQDKLNFQRTALSFYNFFYKNSGFFFRNETIIIFSSFLKEEILALILFISIYIMFKMKLFMLCIKFSLFFFWNIKQMRQNKTINFFNFQRLEFKSFSWTFLAIKSRYLSILSSYLSIKTNRLCELKHQFSIQITKFA